MSRGSTEDFRARELVCTILLGWTQVMTHCQNLQNTQHQEGAHGELWTLVHVMMCQCRFIHCNTATTLMGNVDSRGGAGGQGGRGEAVPA